MERKTRIERVRTINQFAPKISSYDDRSTNTVSPVESTFENAAVKAIQSMQTTHTNILVLRQKVVVIGDYAVGKTALVQMFASGGHNFPKNYVMTLGCEFSVKTVDVPGTNVQVEMYLFDTSGQKVFNQRQMLHDYWSNTSACVFVYDVSNRDSFVALGQWLNEVRATRPGFSMPGIVIANKMDLRDANRFAVTREEGEKFAQREGFQFFETSALRHAGTEAPFNALADEFYKKYVETLKCVQENVL
jgi:intraflagellar transport protein 27